MNAPPTHNGADHDAVTDDGVWLTDREPGELLGPRRVVVTLRDSEPIVISEVPTRHEAVALAERVIEAIDEASARGEWAELVDRLVRPDTVVSVDVELVE
jgi:hypothetical protein